MPESPSGSPVRRWLLVAGGVLLGLALVAGYVVSSIPPDAHELARAGYAQGFEAGRAAGRGDTVRGAAVRRTPMPQAPATTLPAP